MIVLIVGKHHQETADRIVEAVRIEEELQLLDQKHDLDCRIRVSRSRRKIK